MLLVLINSTGHDTVDFMLWLFASSKMPLYTSLVGSWLNQVESLQHILSRREVDSQDPTIPEEVIAWWEGGGSWLELGTDSLCVDR